MQHFGEIDSDSVDLILGSTMKRIYWKSNKVIGKVNLTIAIIAVLGLLCVETLQGYVRDEHYEEKIEAARIMKAGMDEITEYKKQKIGDKYNIGPINPKYQELAQTGLIGIPFSPITSSVIASQMKQASINPNWAALLVELFKQAKVTEGDAVAVAFSGSYPALNLAVLAAAEAMDVKVIAISSVTASGWGANIPELAWLDMERILNEKGITSHRSVAASPGGQDDLNLGISEEGQKLVEEIVKRNQIEFIKDENRTDNLNRRMKIYEQYAGLNQIKTFVNVGGGSISVGQDSKKIFRPGLNQRRILPGSTSDSLLKRFTEQGLPVIHLRHISELTQRYNMPYYFEDIPSPGEGELFGKTQYNKLLVAGVLIAILLVLYVFYSTEYVNLIFTVNKEKSPSEPPEPMV